ncbi:MEKHLA domain-containing protein [Methylomonas sp. MgM2]
MNLQQAPCPANGYHQSHAALLLESYQRLLKRPLFEASSGRMLGQEVFCAEFALLSHDTKSDPLFNYANKTALDLFELSWPELIRMPSRLSAEPINQEARERSMAEVLKVGYLENYSGVRVSKSGKRFLIQNAVIWNVYDEQGGYHGQAAWFKDWICLG